MGTTNNLNIQLDITEKVKCTINNREDKYVMVNPNDMGIVARLGDAIPVINGIMDKWENLVTFEDDEPVEITMEKFSAKFKEMDKELRDIINRIFDYDVCSVCAGGGSMLDIVKGQFVFFNIINALTPVYSDAISKEMDRVMKQMKKHTAKYEPTDHQKKKS